MNIEDKKYIAQFLRRIADELETNNRLCFSCTIRAKNDDIIYRGDGNQLIAKKPEFQDYDIELSVRGLPNEDPKA